MLGPLELPDDARMSFEAGVKCNRQCRYCCCCGATGAVGHGVHVDET